jgi:hypothetical protein
VRGREEEIKKCEKESNNEENKVRGKKVSRNKKKQRKMNEGTKKVEK